jgi:hypothetical protein
VTRSPRNAVSRTPFMHADQVTALVQDRLHTDTYALGY